MTVGGGGRLRRLTPLAVLPLLAAAGWVLSRELGGLTPHQVRVALLALPGSTIGLAAGLTVVSYLVLTLYDALALRHLGRPVPYRRSALAGFLGFAFSQNVGLSVVSGAPVRLRLYTLWGLTASEVAVLLAFNGVTYWLGLLTTTGVALVVGGPELAAGVLPVGGGAVRLLGLAALAVVAAYLGLCAVRRAPLAVGPVQLELPGFRRALTQLALGCVDWAVAASVLWVLLRAHAPIGFAHLLAVFVLAQVVGVASQVPGGIGVFESVVLVLLPATTDAGAGVAVLLAYRMTYYLAPLAVALVVLTVTELSLGRHHVPRLLRSLGEGVGMVAPPVLAAATAVCGGLLVVTGSLPALPTRLRWLAGAVPLAALEVSHLLASVVGTVLLVLAWGLRRRLRAAWWLAVAGLAIGAVSGLLRGWHLGPAVAAALALVALLPARQVFSRRAALLSEPMSPRWVAGVAMVVAGAVWVGLVAHRAVPYSSDLWWRFSLEGDAPRFLRASLGAAAVLLVVGLARLLGPSRPRRGVPGAEELARIRAVVTASPVAAAHLALLGDKRFLLSAAGDAFIMYGVRGRSWIAMGDPIGTQADHAELIWRFRSLSDAWGGRTVFYEVGEASLGRYLELGLTALKIGEEAFVPLEAFSLEGGHRSQLRYTARKLERDGCTFDVVPVGSVGPLLPELRRVSDDWLAAKSTREKGFSLGRFDEDYLVQTPVAVVRAGGRVVAFANLWPGAAGGELSIDLMRFSADAPRGVMDALFVQLLLWGQAGGWSRFGLGMAPLAGVRSGPFAPLWNRLAATVWRLGEHFYNFQGLRRYKEKFDPVWEPRYLVCPGGAAVPGVLADLAALVSGGTLGVISR